MQNDFAIAIGFVAVAAAVAQLVLVLELEPVVVATASVVAAAAILASPQSQVEADSLWVSPQHVEFRVGLYKVVQRWEYDDHPAAAANRNSNAPGDLPSPLRNLLRNMTSQHIAVARLHLRLLLNNSPTITTNVMEGGSMEGGILEC